MIVSPCETKSLRRALSAVGERIDAWGATADVVVTPTVPTVAWPFDEDPVPGSVRGRWVRSSVVWNAAGAPAASVPGPVDGPPTGVQVSGPAGEDAAVLAWAAALELLLRTG